MPRSIKRPPLDLTEDQRRELEVIADSTEETSVRRERARILFAYADREPIVRIARRLGTNRAKIRRCIDRAHELGVISALEDRPRPGGPLSLTSDARAWLISLAQTHRRDLGYSTDRWTMELLARHARASCRQAGFPSLAKVSRTSVSRVLKTSQETAPASSFYVEIRKGSRRPEADAIRESDVAAEGALRGQIEENPNDAKAHRKLGMFLLDAERWEEAETSFRRAAEIDPGCKGALHLYGFSMFKQGKPEEAEQFLRGMVTDSNAEAYATLGHALVFQEKLEEAERWYRAALELNAKSYEVTKNLGIVLLLRRNEEEAEKLLTRTVELCPEDADAYLYRGAIKFAQGREAQADEDARHAHELDPAV